MILLCFIVGVLATSKVAEAIDCHVLSSLGSTVAQCNPDVNDCLKFTCTAPGFTVIKGCDEVNSVFNCETLTANCQSLQHGIPQCHRCSDDLCNVGAKSTIISIGITIISIIITILL